MLLQRKNELEQNLKKIQNKIQNRAQLVAVSKHVDTQDIQILYHLGVRDFGENRPLDLQEKAQALQSLCPEIRWHFIGNIQTNKLKILFSTPQLVAIHSLDSSKHFDHCLVQSKELKNPLSLYLQFNASNEPQKGGIQHKNELIELLRKCQNSPETKLRLSGLMTLAKRGQAGESFQIMSDLRQELIPEFGRLQLSMGMSEDFELALNYGSDVLRIGSLLFQSTGTV